MKKFMRLVLLAIALLPAQAQGTISLQEKLDNQFEDGLDETTRLYHQTHKNKIRQTLALPTVGAAPAVNLKKVTVAASTTNDIVITLPGMGSVEAGIRDYAVPQIQAMGVSVFQRTTNGFVNASDSQGGNITFHSIDEANAYMRQLITNVAKGAFTNQFINKESEFTAFVTAMGYSDQLYWYNCLALSQVFKLVKSSDGSYHLPDFSNFKLGLVRDMLYLIPHATHVVATLTYNPALTNKSGIQQVPLDSAFGRAELGFDYSLEPGYEYLSVRTSFMTAGTNALTMLNLAVEVDHKKHFVFEPLGHQQPYLEAIRFNSTSIEMDITAAPASLLHVVSAQCLTGPWTNALDVATYRSSTTATVSNCGPIGYYRLTAE